MQVSQNQQERKPDEQQLIKLSAIPPILCVNRHPADSQTPNHVHAKI